MRGNGQQRLNGYPVVYVPLHPRATKNGYVFEHIVIAERALGYPLPIGALVHHVDEDIQNNRYDNLVICPDHAYHRLLHQRMRAKAASGHADWRKCKYCKEYDDPLRLKIVPSRTRTSGASVYHSACVNAAFRRRSVIKREANRRLKEQRKSA